MIWFILSVVVCIIFSVWSKWKFSYWKRRTIYQRHPEFLFGDVRQMVFRKKNISDILQDFYDELKRNNESNGGLYVLYTPVWVPRDVELIKKILIADLDYFNSHGLFYHEKDLLSVHLFNEEDEKWKATRAKFSPTFSPTKLKQMFHIVNALGKRLETRIKELNDSKQVLDVKHLTTCFAIDVISTTFFGWECNSFDNPDNLFRKYGTIFQVPRNVKLFLEQAVNWSLLAYGGYSFFPKDINEFFVATAKEALRSRSGCVGTRNDYLDSLVQLLQQPNLPDEEKFTETEAVANMFLMFGAGFETTSTTLKFLLYELAKRPDIQEKVRQEILQLRSRSPSNEIIYEDLAKMKYLEMCIDETLRMYPPVVPLPRKCIKTYHVPGTDQIIEKGTTVMIPNLAIHMDPDMYPEPWTFDPEHFNAENKAGRSDIVFMPFGVGPRTCLGIRFAYMEIKIAMVDLLTHYRYDLNKATPRKLDYLPNTLTIAPKQQIYLDIIPVDNFK